MVRLDLSKLKQVRAILGDRGSLNFKLLKTNQQLDELNCKLGIDLSTSVVRERQVLVDASPRRTNRCRRPSRRDIARGGKMIAHVRARSCANLGVTLSDSQLEASHSYLRTSPILLRHDAHVAGDMIASIDDVPADKNYAYRDYLDLWSSLHILNLATQHKFLDLAQDYLGCTPTLLSINAFRSLPNRQPHKASQVFGRDWEDHQHRLH